MACEQKTLVLISSYADGQLSLEEEKQAVAHLEECADCRKRLEEWKRLQQLFEWAYTVDASEVDEFVLPQSVSHVKHGGTVERSRNSIWGWVPRRVAWAAVAASVVFAISAGYYSYRLPPVLGKILVTGETKQIARMDGGIKLEVGPDSKIVRINDEWIRLEKGSVRAEITHGSRRFRIQTPRLDVYDQGTKFDVGTGRKIDYVIVDEGSVSVNRDKKNHLIKAGQILFTGDCGSPTIGSLPKLEKQDDGFPFLSDEERFVPDSAQKLDWNEGLERLGRRFPKARYNLGGGGGYASADFESRTYLAPIVGLLTGITLHAADITRAMAGEKTVSSEWQIPVTILQVSEVVSYPNLPADVYYVLLVCKHQKLLWKLIGSNGATAEYPFEVMPLQADGSSNSLTGRSVCYNFDMRAPESRIIDVEVQIGSWIGPTKPTLRIAIKGDPNQDKGAALKKICDEFSRSQQLDTKHLSADIYYLDKKPKDKILFAWDYSAGRKLREMFNSSVLGHGGSVAIGAVVTSVPFNKPEIPAGIYLLKLVTPDGSNNAHYELTETTSTECAGKAKSWTVSETPLENQVSMGNATGCFMSVPPGDNSIWFGVDVGYDRNHSLAVRFYIPDRPKFKSGVNHNGRYWADGILSAGKPKN